MSTLDLGKLKFLWRGTWSPSTTYVSNDVVTYNGAVWICTQNHSVGTSTEFSPGKRDKINVLPKTVDTSEIIPIQVTVSSSGSSNFFFIDGRVTPGVTLYPNTHYRFYQKDSSNLAHRFGLSSSIDGIFASGGTEYTSGIQYYGVAGIDGYLDVVLPSNAPTTLYYFSLQDTNYGAGATGKVTVSPSWRGWQCWDQVTSGFTFKGAWTSTTQYYYNDVIEYEGATYLALADHLNKPPATPDAQRTVGSLTAGVTTTYTQYWQLLTPGDRRTEHNAVATFCNKGPIDWPYPMGNNSNPNQLVGIKWISRSGRAYHHGGGYNYNTGLSNNASSYGRSAHPAEICFNHTDWWNSRDNGGSGRLVTPDSQPPRCTQIEIGWDYNYYLFNNGELWSSGTNSNGEMGVGDTSTYQMPRRVQGLNDVKIVKVSCGFSSISATRHVMALDDQGYVWTWGRNNVGQLGLGDTANSYRSSPQRIPRSYFGGERVTDILAMGADNGWSYARVASDNLYAWGRNNENQLGNGDTTNRYRPTKMTNWDPVANNGIRKWQAYGYAGAASFMILDGNGFLWHCGNDYGHSSFATTATRAQLTKSTTVPGGLIVNFWNVWSGDSFGNCATFIRHSNGTTYVCGQGNNYNNTQGTTGGTTQILNPSLLPSLLGAGTGIFNLKEVYVHIAYNSDQRRAIHFLRDDGKVFAQGYNGYGELGNPFIAQGGQNNTDESGSTNFPIVTFTTPSHKVVSIMPGGSGSTDLNWAHGMFYLLANGQITGTGQTRNTSSVGGVGNDNRWWSGNFMGSHPQMGEGGSMNMPISIHYAR